MIVDLLDIPLPRRDEPLLIPWPVQGNPSGFIRFDHAEQWRSFIVNLGLDLRIPLVVRKKYARAQKLYLLGWIDADLIKAGELVALTALELTLVDRYGGYFKKNDRNFAGLLRHLATGDDLDDAQIPLAVRCGSTAIGQLTGATIPTLAQIRNSMAHGDPFDGLPFAGLLELVRDLITFAYRHFIAEHSRGVSV
ncbi:hypothetical protein [Halopseudomonas pelagia]|uniref:hypothetical protein n=1 Tax=Halopseudomonas pelagia TaxID=553151 RepID=UPI0003B49184|nr:hypothetical protein [Halopseudomonas pelagia]